MRVEFYKNIDDYVNARHIMVWENALFIPRVNEEVLTPGRLLFVKSVTYVKKDLVKIILMT